jgi:hypothetical protein
VLRVTDTTLKAASVEAPILDEWFGEVGTTSGPAGFAPSTSFGWSCAIRSS